MRDYISIELSLNLALQADSALSGNVSTEVYSSPKFPVHTAKTHDVSYVLISFGRLVTLKQEVMK